MDMQIFHFRKWTNWIFWYQNRCFQFRDTWLNYYWDKDEIGMIIRGSINLSSATAQRIDSKTLYLSNDKVTYYLKSDSIKDMEDFISRLTELKTSSSPPCLAMDMQIFHFKKWINWIVWYEYRCFEIQDMWLQCYRDGGDVGEFIDGSMNLRNAQAQRTNVRKLRLSNGKVTYYLKADNEKDMAAFIKKLQELNVSVTDK